jgi:hypothetical protein
MTGKAHPLATIWTRPRATMRRVQEHGDRGLWVWLLTAALANEGSMFLLPSILGAASAKESDAAFIESVMVFLGALFLLVCGLVGSAALVHLWRRFAGPRPTRDVLRALGWGFVPLAATLPVTLAFIADRGPAPPGPIAELLLLGCTLWAFVLSACTLAEVHGVTTARGTAILLAVAAVTALVVLGPIFASGAFFQAVYNAISVTHPVVLNGGR